MNTLWFFGLALVLSLGCRSKPKTFSEARKGFDSSLSKTRSQVTGPAPEPNDPRMALVKYTSPVGALSAYVSRDPGDGTKHPAIVWITGGDSSSIDNGVFRRPSPDNDQTARQYREAGIVTMYPSLRGGNDNPGYQEGFLGEVDDVIAAGAYVASLPYVDPTRVYLGGHSTGGTLVLLVAESTDQFRAVFSFGPVADVSGYGQEYLPYNSRDNRENHIRSPIHWLAGIRKPTYVMEGNFLQSNADAVMEMQHATDNPNAKFVLGSRQTHFSILAKGNSFLATKILADTGPVCNIQVSYTDLANTH